MHVQKDVYMYSFSKVLVVYAVLKELRKYEAPTSFYFYLMVAECPSSLRCWLILSENSNNFLVITMTREEQRGPTKDFRFNSLNFEKELNTFCNSYVLLIRLAGVYG